MRLNSSNRVVIVSDSLGVYVGSFEGLGFWSRLDDGGQDSAPVFETSAVAAETVSGWDNAPDDIKFFVVDTVQDYIYRDELECIGINW